MNHVIERRRNLTFPARRPAPHRVVRALRRLWGLAATPFLLGAARLYGAPGLAVRIHCMGLGARAMASGHLRRGLTLIDNPMDSLRYFELDVALKAVGQRRLLRYLDVSSPRLLPVMILRRHPDLVADLLNPITDDLRETAATLAALGLGKRCRLSGALIENVDYPEQSFDLITSISVIEHIADDSRAIARMWSLLRPGGSLLITVPCARESCEEYTSLDEYGLLAKDRDGYVYWQRYYDEAALSQRIFSITGQPTKVEIFGEKRPGSYDENVRQKRIDQSYPYWREPLMMGREYRRFARLEQLPGMGVIAMEFIKPSHNPS